ncbi:ubiquitinyl hydrolase 1 [Yamadazyma tenuis]|uniref:Ubiquitin carboxyl-terminal hydrolase n=1 Tax=Candida tenuis (strain ATCC 10573 / BCRC 21748 / CBS 615 / JCM 9827 / NBRC 10315 / NRRL Y-1498 / VKM Y-70) TaxID=590646 RepID=G3AX36_CANTC|nr:uncharacterized protein CANTEDRAFT_112421 [Yamadazyma tenuis ATCC 10573]XP_006684133.1 cysteine proteinase [Yamadazyma tenuis ATCC 10573]EGV66874.1 hypothetical protein CANTEDRAFT_112421 [Yamadazyma tenuis ATCC 10573]EGV66875.1 cysteine proteinase [Yamadazyma tenuis ATCC 10573]WEJ95191.1 ubiquitinyl hydrolase 1 [Yamadazyma tenuis]
MPDSKRVIPLESNPDIFTAMAHKLGLSPVLEFHDVLSLTEPDLVAFLPQPVFGVTLLFPITKEYEDYRTRFDSTRAPYSSESIDTVRWFKQTIGNGCGLYALLHLITNLQSDLIIDNSLLNSFLIQQLNRSLSTEDIAKLVENLEQQIQLDENYGSGGQTEAPPPEISVELHFITFVKGKDNHLYELDGRRTGPVDLGESVGGSNIIEDPKLNEKIQFYISNTNEANKHNFAMIALGPSLD